MRPLPFLLSNLFLCLLLVYATGSIAQTLPDPLLMGNGKRVQTARQWTRERRPELLNLFASEMYGQTPPRPSAMRFVVVDEDRQALGGLATRKQVVIYYNGTPQGPQTDVLLYIPNQVKGPAPAIIGLNFWGNHTIHPDPGIRLAKSFVESGKNNPYIDLSCVQHNRATEACRGTNARQWPVEKILKAGYALVTAYREDVASDNAASTLTTGVHQLFPSYQQRSDNFGTIGAWAWALSRIMDYLETDKAIDRQHVAVFGWSRLGKAALWAGASDPRFALVISHESGAGGAKLFHRGVGESIRRLCTVFPHWYAKSFRQYMDKDTLLPFDQHMVIGLVAPRPVYIGSAQDDKGADPAGEFASAVAATPVYKLFSTNGLPASTLPPLNQSVQGQIGYHIRPGGHDVTDYDWEQYLRFADNHFRKR
nr:acetylxylan esterase [uncultured Arsenicibacter sp.]